MASYSEPYPPRRITDHAVTRFQFTNRKCMEIIVESIPEKNLVNEFHGPRAKFVSCDKRFKLESVLELSVL